MNYNQILSYFQIVYQDRISTKIKKDSIKCTTFRKICNNYKINDQKRLLIKNPYKSNKMILKAVLKYQMKMKRKIF